MRIYQATLRNLQAVQPLFQKYRQFYKQEAALAEDSNAFIQARLSDPGSVIFIAEIDGTPAGIAHLYHRLSSVSVRRVLTLNDLYVEEKYRKHGVATALIKQCSNYAVSQGIYSINLETAKNNVKAKHLYESLGYQLESAYDTYDLEIPSSATISKIIEPKFPITPAALCDKTVVMTGATTVLGTKMVAAFNAKGFKVLGCGEKDQELPTGNDFSLVNVAHLFSVQEWAAYLLHKYGVPQFVINNNITDEHTAESADSCSTTIDPIQQYLGTKNVTQTFLPALSVHKNRTAIFNLIKPTTNVDTVAANAAIDALTLALAKENTDTVTLVTIETDGSNAANLVSEIINSNSSLSGKKLEI